MVLIKDTYQVLRPINNPKARGSHRRVIDDKGTLTGGMTLTADGTYMDKQSLRNGGYGHNKYEIEFYNLSANLAKKLVKAGDKRRELVYGTLDPVKF